MGFTTGDKAAQGLTTEQRYHLFGQSTDLNIMSWILSIVRSAPTKLHNPVPRARSDHPAPSTYTFSEPLSSFGEEKALYSRVLITYHGQTH